MTTKDSIQSLLDKIIITEIRFEEEPYCNKHKTSIWNVKTSSNNIACNDNCDECDYFIFNNKVYFEGFLDE